MKRKLMALIISVFMLFSLAGCNTQGLALIKELEKVSQWQAVEQSGSIEVSIGLAGEKVKLSATYEAYSQNENLQLEMILTPTLLEVNGQSMDLTSGQYAFAPVKMYMDGMTFYLSSSYLLDVCRFAGVDATEVLDLSKPYIALDMQDMMELSGMDLETLVEQNKQGYDLYKGLQVDLPITKEGSTYTFTLNGSQMVDVVCDLALEGVKSQEALLRSSYESMGLSAEEIDEIFAQVEMIYGDESKEMIKPYAQGCQLKVDFDFTENAYTSNYVLEGEVEILGETLSLGMVIKDTVKKADAKVITFPTEFVTYTMEDLMAIAGSGMISTVYVPADQAVVKGNVVYVPVRDTLGAIGIEVMTYDGVSQSVLLEDFGIALPVIINSDRAYASVETFASIGILIEVVE